MYLQQSYQTSGTINSDIILCGLHACCYSIITIVELNIRLFSNTVSELRKITSSDCICPDDDQIYECTVVGDFGGITVWRGTAFSDCEINLLHSQYVSREGAFGNCNGRAIRGRSLRIENDRYVSQLSVTPTELSSGINGDTIECNYDDGSVVHTIGNYSISLTKGKSIIFIGEV